MQIIHSELKVPVNSLSVNHLNTIELRSANFNRFNPLCTNYRLQNYAVK